MEKEDILFKCANDLNVTVKKDNGEVVMNEDCCTCVNLVLKNTGELATSFLGSHNPDIIKVLDKSIKNYFKSLKKTLKKMYNDEIINPEINVNSEEEIPEDNKWSEDQKTEDTPKSEENKKDKSAKSQPKTTATKKSANKTTIKSDKTK